MADPKTPSHPDPTSGSARHFFDLPPEIRDNIYASAFADTSRPTMYRLRFRDFELIAHKANIYHGYSPHCLREFPSWMLANKRFHDEAMATFATNKLFGVRQRGSNLNTSAPPSLSYQTRALLRSIRTIKIPTMNNSSSDCGRTMTMVQRRYHDVTLPAFIARMGKNMRIVNLELEWRYKIYDISSDPIAPNILFDMDTLMSWRHTLSHVTVEASITQEVPRPHSLEAHSFYAGRGTTYAELLRRREEAYTRGREEAYRGTKKGLWDAAERFSRMLVVQKTGGATRVTMGEEELYRGVWSFREETCFRMIEGVSYGTRGSMGLALQPSPWRDPR
jgi:hypothetical protein